MLCVLLLQFFFKRRHETEWHVWELARRSLSLELTEENGE